MILAYSARAAVLGAVAFLKQLQDCALHLPRRLPRFIRHRRRFVAVPFRERREHIHAVVLVRRTVMVVLLKGEKPAPTSHIRVFDTVRAYKPAN